jgi:monoamine oxidase
MQFAMWKVNRMAKKVPLLDPKNCEMASHWDSMTVQTWMEKNLWSEKVRLLFATAVRILLGSELS